MPQPSHQRIGLDLLPNVATTVFALDNLFSAGFPPARARSLDDDDVVLDATFEEELDAEGSGSGSDLGQLPAAETNHVSSHQVPAMLRFIRHRSACPSCHGLHRGRAATMVSRSSGYTALEFADGFGILRALAPQWAQ